MNEKNISKKTQKKGWFFSIQLRALGFIAIGIIFTCLGLYLYQRNNPNFGSTPYADHQQAAVSRQSTSEAAVQKLPNDMQLLSPGKSLTNDNLATTEISHLVRMADIILSTEADVKTAIELLQIARDYATSLGWLDVYHTLAKDIASLQNTPMVDHEVLIQRLDSLNQKILNLQPIPPKLMLPKPVTIPESGITNSKPTNRYLLLSQGKRILDNLKLALQEIIIIRRQEVSPLPNSDQYANLKFNIQSIILQAEWAVLHHQSQLYQTSLSQVTTWINHYFLLSTPEAQNILQILAELKNINVTPPLPNLSASIGVINNSAAERSELPKTESKIEPNVNAPTPAKPEPALTTPKLL